MINIEPIGHIESSIKDLKSGNPKMESAPGAVKARIHIKEEFSEALIGMEKDRKLIILTWLHKSNRTTLKGHPRGNPEVPIRGVFSTRSPSRPNPIGLHEVTVEEVGENWVLVNALEAIDGTPVIDIKNSQLPSELSPVWAES